jgi:hypothetical protein
VEGNICDQGTQHRLHLANCKKLKGVMEATSDAPEVHSYPMGATCNAAHLHVSALRTAKAILKMGANIMLGSMACMDCNGLLW